MKRVLFYGNCQPRNMSRLFKRSLRWYKTSIECHNTEMDEESFKSRIKKSDVIIMQPIRDGYRDRDYLSTSYILENCRDDCKAIIFNVLYFTFYYPDALPHLNHEEDALGKPTPYHYTSLIESYNNGLSVDGHIEQIINNENLMSTEDLEKIASEFLDDLREREERAVENYENLHNDITFLKASDYIENNYKEKLLFYTMNHPTGDLFQYICKKTLEALNLDPNRINGTDPLTSPRLILYKCIQKIVNFDISEHKPRLNRYTRVDSICKQYYEVYDEEENKKFIDEFGE